MVLTVTAAMPYTKSSPSKGKHKRINSKNKLFANNPINYNYPNRQLHVQS